MTEHKTNIYAILSLIFAFVFFPLGFVFGIVGLYQIKRTHEHGKGLAIAGVLLSSLAFFGVIIIYSAILFAVGTVAEEVSNLGTNSQVIATSEEESKSEPLVSLSIISKKTFTSVGNTEFGFGKKASGMFLFYDIEIENLDSESVYITSNDLRLFDNQGSKYFPDTEAMLYRQDSFVFETINPGIKQRGIVIFDVADSKAEYELRVYDNVLGSFD